MVFQKVTWTEIDSSVDIIHFPTEDCLWYVGGKEQNIVAQTFYERVPKLTPVDRAARVVLTVFVLCL